MLKEVCEAEVDRKQKLRPQQTLRQIIERGETDFHKIFSRFWETEGVYGFGDLQVKKMLEQIQR
jgi:transposase